MSKDMSSQGALYKNAASQYNNAINQFSGNNGYGNSINQAKAGAAVEAANSQAQAQTAARNAGMSKAQAAAKGASTASSDYLKSFRDQQSAAITSGNNEITARQNQTSQAQTEDQNRYNKSWGNLGVAAGVAQHALTGGVTGSIANAASTAASDERLKDYKEISSKLKYMNPDFTKTLIVEVKK